MSSWTPPPAGAVRGSSGCGAGSGCRPNLHGRAARCAYAAVPAAVREVDNQTQRKPDEEAHPGNPRQTGHQVAAEDHAQDWDYRHQRGFERTASIRVGVAQQPHSYAYQHEREQRSDIVNSAISWMGRNAEVNPTAIPV